MVCVWQEACHQYTLRNVKLSHRLSQLKGEDSLQGALFKGQGGPGAFGRMSQGGVDPRTKEEIQTVQGGPSTWSNPAGRVSVQFAPGAVGLLFSVSP